MSKPLSLPLMLRHFNRSSLWRQQHNIPLTNATKDLCVSCQCRAVNSRQFHNAGALSNRATTNNEATNKFNSSSTQQSGGRGGGTGNGSLLDSPPDITTHYTIFPKTIPNGPPPASPFDISIPDLRREFLSLQNLAHPDKYPPGPSKQRAEALSARINEAYRALSDPLSRAQYLLDYQHGIDVTSEDGAKTNPLDTETLMQVMEVQEAIEEAEGEETVAELKRDNEKRLEECVRSLAGAFNRQDIDTARMECIRLRFWYSVREGLREWEPGSRTVRLVH